MQKLERKRRMWGKFERGRIWEGGEIERVQKGKERTQKEGLGK